MIHSCPKTDCAPHELWYAFKKKRNDYFVIVEVGVLLYSKANYKLSCPDHRDHAPSPHKKTTMDTESHM